MDSPTSGAVLVQGVEVGVCDELAPVHPRLDGPQSSQHPDLLHVADDGVDVEPLALGVDGVEAAHQVLQK